MLNGEGWRPPKRRDTFNASMVHHMLLRTGAISIKYRRPESRIDRRADEWTIRELAELLGVPQPTVYGWIQKGRLSSRDVPATGRRPAKLVHADAATIAKLKAARATPPPWRRLPPPQNHPHLPQSDS